MTDLRLFLPDRIQAIAFLVISVSISCSEVVSGRKRVGEPISSSLLSNGGVSCNLSLTYLFLGTKKPFAVDELDFSLNLFNRNDTLLEGDIRFHPLDERLSLLYRHDDLCFEFVLYASI
jgi:hypothetical protein